MIMHTKNSILSGMSFRYILFLTLAVLLFCAGGCTSGKYSSSKSLYRKPAPKHRHKCGCFLPAPVNKPFVLYYSTNYVLQARNN